jgi:hypothetical protein
MTAEKMNSEQHKNIIEEHVIKLLVDDYTRQQNNATCHSQSKTYLLKKGYNMLDWPTQNADINPIKNIWGFIKLKISGRASDKFQLFEEIRSIWEEIPWDLIFNCYQSMPYRMLDILYSKGDCIDY